MFKSIFEYREKNRTLKHIDEPVLKLILGHVNPFHNNTRILNTSTVFNVETITEPIDNFINLRKINYIKELNEYFQVVNEKMFNKGLFIGCVENYAQRKNRIISDYFILFAYPIYFLDFIFNRVWPKLALTQKININKLRTKNRAISKAEVFGRLYACGFEMKDYREINNLVYFIAQKVSEPGEIKEYKYGMLYKMERIGINGKPINVYKIRTMNPYSEFLQSYIYDQHNLKEGGKFKDDFRIASWGRFLRKYWLDELPMLFNVLKGELKLVGVRPLSKHYFDLYDDDLKNQRTKQRPGLIPPYYADLPKSLEEIMESERRYLNSYEKHKFKTDMRYLYLALKNILFNKARSS